MSISHVTPICDVEVSPRAALACAGVSASVNDDVIAGNSSTVVNGGGAAVDADVVAGDSSTDVDGGGAAVDVVCC